MNNIQNYLNILLFNKNTKKYILDPLTCIIRCATLSFKPPGTKISIINNKISFNDPTILQGTIRWTTGDKREDLHNIYYPIIKSTQWYDIKDPNILNIFSLAVKGLDKLKNSYDESSIIVHSLELYINIINNFITDNNERNKELYFKNIQNRETQEISLSENKKKNCHTEDNMIYKSLKELWNDNQISIVNNILIQMSTDSPNKKDWLSALDIILSNKENNVNNIILKNTTSLNLQ